MRDAIGDRLERPWLVPREHQHLIADDQRRCAAIVALPAAGRVLDIGCSDGAITRRIQEAWPGAQVTGMDLQETCPGLARYVQWDIRRPVSSSELAGTLWDRIYACEVFEHLTPEEAGRALRSVLGLLHPTGDLVVTVPNRHPHDRYEVSCRARWAWPDHRHSYTQASLRAWLAPWFQAFAWHAIEPGVPTDEGIWLMVRASQKR